MKRIYFSIIFCLFFVAYSKAQVVLDQSNTTGSLNAGDWCEQTFTAGYSGILNYVTVKLTGVYIDENGMDPDFGYHQIICKLYKMNGSVYELLDSSDYFVSGLTTSGNKTITFNNYPCIKKDSIYKLEFVYWGCETCLGNFFYGANNPYLGGEFVGSLNGDLVFSTHVNYTNEITYVINDTICYGDSAQLYAYANGSNVYWYLNSSSPIWDTIFSGNTYKLLPNQTTSYQVSTKLGSCESNRIEITSFVNPNPTVYLVSDTIAVCENGGDTLIALGADSYLWQTNFIADTILHNDTLIFNNVSSGSINNGFVVGYNQYNCFDTTDFYVDILNNPTTQLSTNVITNTFCFGDSILLAASGADLYFDENLNATEDSIWLNAVADTTVLIKGIFNNGCFDTTNLSIKVNPLPILQVTSNAADSSNQFCPLSTIIYSLQGADSVKWVYNWAINPDVNGNKLTILYGSVGNYTGTAVGIDSNGCANSINFSFKVNEYPQGDILNNNDTSLLCKGDSMLLTATPLYNHYQYVWSTGTAPGGNLFGDSVTVSPAISTLYTLYITDTITTCFKISQKMVYALNLPQVSFSSPDTLLCDYSNPVSLHANPLGGIYQQTISSDTMFYPSITNVGLNQFIYLFTDTNGCVNTDTLNLTVDVCTSLKNTDYNNLNIQFVKVENQLIINHQKQLNSIAIVNSVGQEINCKVVFESDNKTRVELNDFETGVYWVKILFNNVYQVISFVKN